MNNKLNLLKRDAPRAATPIMKKEMAEEVESCEKVVKWMEDGNEVRSGMDQWTTKDVYYLNQYSLITAKPAMYLVNLSEKDFQVRKRMLYTRRGFSSGWGLGMVYGFGLWCLGSGFGLWCLVLGSGFGLWCLVLGSGVWL
jgi:hypothetical protein